VSETEQEQPEAATPDEPTEEEIVERTETAVESAGQPTPDEEAPGYGEPEQTEPATDEARRVHPDEDGYTYNGDDSAAQVNDAEADA
jgi:hypothetical protein